MKQWERKAFSPSGIPVLAIKFKGARRKFTFEVYTGFSGSLLMPIDFLETVRPIPKAEEFFVLADGSRFSVLTGLATIVWFGKNAQVVVGFADTSAFLLGRNLLEDARLCIDFKRKTLNLSR